MVAIKTPADIYLKAPPKGISAILLYGGDAGLVSERAQALAKTMAAQANPPGEILRIDDLDLDGNPERLVVELGTMPMFGGRKVIRTQQSRRVTAALLKPLIEGGLLEGFLIVEAGSLKAEDGMRKLFEAASSAAAIPCYGDEARDLDGLVSRVLGQYKLDIAPDARRMLIARLGADRGLSRGEIEKVALYVHGRSQVTEADIEAVVGDASEMAIDKIITAAVSGRPAIALVESDRALAAGESAQGIMILTLRYLQRLHRVRMALESGASMEDALKGLRPPVFYKQRDAFVAQVELWSGLKLARALTRISETMSLSRAGGEMGALDDVVLVQGMLLDVARLAAFRAK
jgi:DNA polymerase III subunit delta